MCGMYLCTCLWLFFVINCVNFFYADNVPELCAMKSYYHIYTKGLVGDLIFRDREDYIAGMNYVAICVHQSFVRMLAFVLMSNHFHFVVYAEAHEAEQFINLYKNLISRYVTLKYGVRKLLYKVKTTCASVDITDEGLKRLIAYVLNNPVNAGVNCMPQSYEWGSGRCYFSNIDYYQDSLPVTRLGVREACMKLKSKIRLSEKYYINTQGYIEPSSYVDVRFVEDHFRRAKSFEYFLSVSHRKTNFGALVFSDMLLKSMLDEIIEKRYDANSLDEMEPEEIRSVVMEFRKQFGCTAKQIARIFNLSLDAAVDIIG